MAFQPIVDVQDGSVYAYEALVRGPQGESAASMLAQVNRHAFDQHCRVKAITLAGQLDLASSTTRSKTTWLDYRRMGAPIRASTRTSLEASGFQ